MRPDLELFLQAVQQVGRQQVLYSAGSFSREVQLLKESSTMMAFGAGAPVLDRDPAHT